MSGEFWRLERVKAETGLCTTAIYDGMSAGIFPKNFPISKQSRAWLADDVRAWKSEILKAAGRQMGAA